MLDWLVSIATAKWLESPSAVSESGALVVCFMG
jgi:hypothetical protein